MMTFWNESTRKLDNNFAFYGKCQVHEGFKIPYLIEPFLLFKGTFFY